MASRTIFNGSAAGDAAATAGCIEASSLPDCACGIALAGMAWRLATAPGWPLALAVRGVDAVGMAGAGCVARLPDAASTVGDIDVDAMAGAFGMAGLGSADSAAVLLATAGRALALASPLPCALAAGASTAAAGSTAVTVSCCAARVAGTATAAGGVASGIVEATCSAAVAGADPVTAAATSAGACVGACHSHWPATAAASSATPPAAKPRLKFIAGAGLAGTARTCP